MNIVPEFSVEPKTTDDALWFNSARVRTLS